MRVCLFVLLAAVCAIRVSAQSGVLPDSAGSWRADGPVTIVRPSDLEAGWSPWPNAQAVLKESGLSRIEERTYRRGADQATLRVFQLSNPTSAYEFYTFQLSPGMSSVDLGDGAAIGETGVRILAGNLVVNADLSAKAKPETLAELVSAVKSKADPTPFPPLRSYLPIHWLVFGSQKYALGPEAFRDAMVSLDQVAHQDLSIELFQDDAEVMLARYQGEKGGGVLLLALYPTPQVAENRLHHLQQAISPAAKAAGANVERKASMLSIVFGAAPMHAQAIRDEVNYETEVMWNEPRTTATDPPLVLVLFKIFLFTSLFLVVATIMGLFFGGVRVLIKHWLPGKVFDRPQDIEVIQLGLSGKKIDPTDMY